MKFVRRHFRSLLFSALILVLNATASVSHAQQPWSGILSPSRAVNWSNVGAAIPTNRTQCGSTVAAGTSAATINSDLSGCASGTYLLLGSGTFNLSAGLVLPANVTLRGSGAKSTFLVFSSGFNCRGQNVNICAASADTNYWGGPSNSATWRGASTSSTVNSGTYTQGGSYISLSSVTNLQIGKPLILDQIDDQSDNGGLYVGCEYPDGSATCYSQAGPNGFERGSGSLSTIRGQQQMVKVTSISGSGPYTVGITPGIYAANWRSSQSPQAWWATSPIENVGIENLSIDSTGDLNDAVLFFNCQNCWVKGVRSVVTSGTVGTGWFHVGMWLSNHVTVRDSYFYGTGGDSYVVSVGIGSDNLVENNIMQYPSYYQLYNSDCEGCVAGYNFSASTLFQTGNSNWLEQPSGFHGTVLYSLSEGNISAGHYGDSFHGTHDLDTFFRNRMDGREQDGGTATTSNTLPVIIFPGSRYYNLVGNVLGTVGYNTAYKCGSSCPSFETSIYDFGQGYSMSDPLSASTTLLWGNWDSANNGVQWNSSEVPSNLSSYGNAVPSSHTLPASFYYSSTPSWWPSGKVWPPIGPDVTSGNVGQCSGGTNDSNEVISSKSGQCSGGSFKALATVTSNPAMDCYFNNMSGVANGMGGPLSFDPSACYGSGSGSGSNNQPGAPIALSASVQ
ncbi:hypothetical protein P8935_13555 [Telmatobacter sp. DSM 110680]|uniref:Right handed beta helix region n=1 Tax=Telmatobacter sp. DSM 110680 TaxID=3036704 RepID=A0AAU7DD58_9BACT